MRRSVYALAAIGLALLVAVGYAAPAIAGERWFFCTFVSEIKVTTLSLTNPTVAIKEIEARYTFLIDDKGREFWFNRDWDMTAQPLPSMSNDGHITFIESNTSNNYFIVSIFTGPKPNSLYPAIKSLHSWHNMEFYYPSQSLGECSAISK